MAAAGSLDLFVTWICPWWILVGINAACWPERLPAWLSCNGLVCDFRLRRLIPGRVTRTTR